MEIMCFSFFLSFFLSSSRHPSPETRDNLVQAPSFRGELVPLSRLRACDTRKVFMMWTPGTHYWLSLSSIGHGRCVAAQAELLRLVR